VNWKGKTVFVTGATGFIGGRVCERLVQSGARDVRALVHTPKHAARIGRLPIQLCPGSLLDQSSLRQAMENAKVVIHCGLGVARGIVKGTQNLLEAAESAGVERVVHMSTAAVYGLTPRPGSESEESPVPRTGDAYCDNKAEAEKVVLRFARRGLPAVILRPSIVYGPYSAWSTRLVQELKDHQAALIDGGNGACNTTYVDNLVDAIFLAVEREQGVGQAFFITDGERITWGDFIRAHAKMIGEETLSGFSSQEIRDYYASQPGMLAGSVKAAGQVLRSREFRQLLLRIPLSARALASLWRWSASLDEQSRTRLRERVGVRGTPSNATQNGRCIPDEVTLATQTGTVFFSIAKAQKLLDYKPRIPFAHGIARVEQWLRFANYL
jgi:nucleoside-diphosphate-sugar epimerase